MTVEEIKVLEKKVTENDAVAMNELAKALEEGDGVTEDKERAMELFEKSAALNYPNAMVNLAGRIYDLNKPKALDLLNRAGEMGFYGAFFALAKFAENESDQLKNFCKAAERGHAQSQYYAGCLYHKNNDIPNAIKYWEKAAENQEPESCHNLAIYYVTPGENYNLDKAITYAKKANELGNDGEGLYLYLKMWKLLSTEYSERKEIHFWTNKKGESSKIFSAAVAAPEEMNINDISLLIFEPRDQDNQNQNIGKVIHTELIKCNDFLNAVSVWKDYKEENITLKDVRPSQKAKYMVSIFHELEDKLIDFE